MEYLIVENLPPYDGRYELDPARELTTREWGWIKRLSGYGPLTVDEGRRNVDPELWTVYALILLHRAGKLEAGQVPDMFERLADQQFFTTIRLEAGPDEPGDGDGVDDPTESSNGNTSSSGPGLTPRSVSSDGPSSRTGTRPSPTSARR